MTWLWLDIQLCRYMHLWVCSSLQLLAQTNHVLHDTLKRWMCGVSMCNSNFVCGWVFDHKGVKWESDKVLMNVWGLYWQSIVTQTALSPAFLLFISSAKWCKFQGKRLTEKFARLKRLVVGWSGVCTLCYYISSCLVIIVILAFFVAALFWEAATLLQVHMYIPIIVGGSCRR